MIYTTINKSAADAALTAIVGPQWKGIIEKLYELLDTAERQGYSDGYIVGRVDAGEDNWQEGYCQGIAAATSAEQPELPEGFVGTDYYEGDSGDETTYDAEVPVAGLPPMQEQRKSNPFSWS